jgi:3-dehydroquinate dehydratase-2
MAHVLVLNGPNLNLLGTREPEKYGHDTLQNIEDRLASLASDHQIAFFQSNIEGELINRIHQAQVDKIDFILINPAAFTHTSIALRDAMLAVNIPFIEIHLSNVYARESFRHHSDLSDIAVAVISGLGAQGYELALAAALSRVAETED